MADSKLLLTSSPVPKKDVVTTIIAMDGSEFSNYALKFYVECLHRPGNHVICTHRSEFKCITDPTAGNISEAVAEMAKDLKEVEEKSADFVVKLTERMKQLGINGTIERIRGDAGPAIVALAKERHADYIVVGCRGRGKDRKTFTGSVTDYVTHHSHVPVLIAKNEEHMEQLHSHAHAHLKHPKKHDGHATHTKKAIHK
ncbi:universal stress protein YxiE-like [Mercenaria mercenaria]|uniref:universal stress protein YxiE-like n=1 Tax=Mercenaria mercenaria TaxID=6596 RepID=UPI001E1DB5E0|nr:universal stress protein YxiE-like [Mercenaria mercenaria]